MQLVRNDDYRLAHWDRDSGFGLVLGRPPHGATLILSPLSLMAFTFSDGPFGPDEFRAFLRRFPETAPALEDGTAERSLAHLHARGLLRAPGEAAPAPEQVALDQEGTPPLRSLYVYGTDRCNHGCYHCYQPTRRQRGNEPRIEDGEPSTARILALIDEAIPLGLRSVKFTGGEPFLRSDLVELVNGAAARGLRTSIESNGTGMTDEAARALARAGTQVSISLDGSEAELHDRLRGCRGAFRTALESVDRVVAAGGRVKVITAVSRRNADDLEAIAGRVASHGVRGWKLNPVNSLGDATERRAAEDMLGPLEIHALFTRLRRDRLGERHGLALFLEGPPALFSLREIAQAGCGTCPFLEVLGLLADGRLSFCGIGYSEPSLVLGHAGGAPLAELWRGHPVLRRARAAIPAALEGICRDCAFLGSCRGSCRAIAYQREKSFASAHPWCEALAAAGRFPSQYVVRASAA